MRKREKEQKKEVSFRINNRAQNFVSCIKVEMRHMPEKNQERLPKLYLGCWYRYAGEYS